MLFDKLFQPFITTVFAQFILPVNVFKAFVRVFTARIKAVRRSNKDTFLASYVPGGLSVNCVFTQQNGFALSIRIFGDFFSKLEPKQTYCTTGVPER